MSSKQSPSRHTMNFLTSDRSLIADRWLAVTAFVVAFLSGPPRFAAAQTLENEPPPASLRTASAGEPVTAPSVSVPPAASPAPVPVPQASDVETPAADGEREPATRPYAVTPGGEVKAGAAMLNLRLGPMFSAFAADARGRIGTASGGKTVGVSAEFGYGFGREHNIYLIAPLSYHYVPATGAHMVSIQLGAQFDIPIRSVPGLFLYPRVAVGYVGLLQAGETTSVGMLTPEFGIKYVIKKRVNVGIEPLSIPMIFHPLEGWILGFYRISGSVGVNF